MLLADPVLPADPALPADLVPLVQDDLAAIRVMFHMLEALKFQEDLVPPVLAVGPPLLRLFRRVIFEIFVLTK